MRSFTTEELEQATGFDRRTIAYYVQMGLIPKVGRRGPRTRYPKLVMDRLLCIRRVRESEEAGAIEPVSLGAMRTTFDHVPAELIARVANGQTPVAPVFAVGAAPAERSHRASRTALEAAWSATEVREPSAPSAFDDRTSQEQLAVRTMIEEPATASADVSAGEGWDEAADPAQDMTPSEAPDEAGAATPASVDPGRTQADYRNAFNLLKQSRYERAITAFRDFLASYPDSEYADKAQFWLGEAFYVNRLFEQALVEYNVLLQNYPDSRKLAQAQLKAGFCQLELGQIEPAKQQLEDLIQHYPGTTAARLAQDRLKKIATAPVPADMTPVN